MLTSLYSAVSGLQANGNEISVIGNNIANSNTIGFKGARATFEDIMSSSLGGGSSLQVGRGVLTGAVMPVLTQSSFDTTQNATDLAIDGTGFFVVKKDGTNQNYFTRAGDFIFNKNGKLVNPSGYIVQGWSVNSETNEPYGDITDVDISKISSSSKATSEVSLGVNLDSTSETKFVITDDNNQIYFDDGGGSYATYTIEEGIYTGDSLAEKIQNKLGVTDLTVSYDSVTGKFNFANDSGSTVKLGITNSAFTMSDILGFPLTSSSTDISIADGTTQKSTSYPNLTLKTVKVTSDNNKIIFSETNTGGTETEYTATIATGTYSLEPYLSSGEVTSELVEAIKTALNGADDGSGNNPTCTYDVSYDSDTGKYTITATDTAAGTIDTVKFYWGDATVSNDPGADTSAEQILGFVTKTSENKTDPSVLNSFTIDVSGASGSGSLESVYAPISIFDNTTYAYSSSMNIYDTLGNPHTITFYFKKVAENYWEWHATASSDDLDGALPDDNSAAQVYEVGNGGYLTFNSSGSLQEATGTSDLYFNFAGGAKSLQNISLDFGSQTSSGGSGLDGVTQFASSSTTFSQSQNGYPAGTLVGYSVDQEGVISGIYSNGEIKGLAKIAIAKFQNPWGLDQAGKNLFAQTVESGDAIIGAANSGGRGKIMSSALERSNVDIAEEFVKMISAQRAYQANSRVITTSDQLLMEVVNLKR